MDNDGADGHSSDSYSKSFLPRFRALGDPCIFIGPFLLPWNRIVKSKNPSFRILDYFYFSTRGTIEYLLTLWLAGFAYVMETNRFERRSSVLYRI